MKVTTFFGACFAWILGLVGCCVPAGAEMLVTAHREFYSLSKEPIGRLGATITAVLLTVFLLVTCIALLVALSEPPKGR